MLADRRRKREYGPVLARITAKTADGTPMSPDELALASAFERPPAGTEGLTRTLLALLVLSLVGLALATVLVSVDTDLRNTIVTALLSILAAIAGFYFGSRTAQTSAEQATRSSATAVLRASPRHLHHYPV